MFSLSRLVKENSGLANRFLWRCNPSLHHDGELWLHLGCGARVFDGFVNLDICPQDVRVVKWNLLDLWPDELIGTVEGMFSEDCLEHFHLGEQVYILCNINRALKPGGVARMIMPGVHKLIDGKYAWPEGIGTQADALNYWMRFTGHRWLHDQQSLAQLASLCGFDATATPCATSTVTKFNSLNLRGELDSASFANDLRKTRNISRRLLPHANVNGATWVEDLCGTTLFVATEPRPTVEYVMPNGWLSSMVCTNIRSSNLTATDWNAKSLTVNGQPWQFDETLKSQSCMNIITRGQLKQSTVDCSRLVFSPAFSPGEYFTLGCAELFSLVD